jgi:hypothetical protein
MTMQMIQECLSALTVGEPCSYETLVMTPLLAARDAAPDYLILDEALAGGDLRITEVSAGGSVPELQLVNHAAQAVLLLDGEELVGAKQNRILNLSLLAPAGTTLTIPVSCVEAGRWSHLSPEFSSEGRAFYSAGRARKASHVTESLRMHGERQSRQGEIWEDIKTKSQRMDSRSATDAMACLYRDYETSVSRYVEAMQPAVNQVGAVFSIDGGVRGLDLFDFPATLRKLLPKLVVSYALDAIEAAHGSAGHVTPDVRTFLHEVAEASVSVHPSVGEGRDLRLSSPTLAGGALQARERIVHLCAFRTDSANRQGHADDQGTNGSAASSARMASAAIRRRGRQQ